MKCKVTFRHMKASDSIREYVEDKVSKLDRLLNEDKSEVHVVVSVEKLQQIAHFELIISGALRVRADDKSENIYSSIDVAVDKMVSQVKRYRSKIRDHHRGEAHKLREVPYQVIHLPKTGEEELEAKLNLPQVIRHDRMVAQEMHLNDAVVQMDVLNSDFLVFTDSDSQKMNVMYRLPDGQFGLIETQSS